MSVQEQGSKEWLDFRRTRVGSSESAALMGVCPYQTAYELYHRKKGTGKEAYVHKAMQEGTRKEPLARDWYNQRMGDFFAPIVKTHPIYERIHASIDGMTFDGDRVLEIKSPTLDVFNEIMKSGIPDNYFCQCQHIMLVTGLDEVEFLMWIDEITFYIQLVKRDESYILKLLDAIIQFLQSLDNDTPPEKTKRKTSVSYEVVKLKKATRLAKIIKDSKTRMEKAREELIKISDGRNITGEGFSVFHSQCQGNIDYSRVPQLQDIDLDVYRKPSYMKSTVKVD